MKTYTYDTTDEIIFEETQKAAYDEQCEQAFVHQEQPNEDIYVYYEKTKGDLL